MDSIAREVAMDSIAPAAPPFFSVFSHDAVEEFFRHPTFINGRCFWPPICFPQMLQDQLPHEWMLQDQLPQMLQNQLRLPQMLQDQPPLPQMLQDQLLPQMLQDQLPP